MKDNYRQSMREPPFFAEEALARELERRRCEAVTSEVMADLAAAKNYVAEHGSYADLVRDHYRGKKADTD